MNAEYTWTVRVTAASPKYSTAFARAHQLRIGAPISFDSKYECTTSLEHLLAAVGSDVINGLLSRAKRTRIEIDNVEATIDCMLNNPLTFLDVVGEEGDPGIKTLTMIVYVSTLANEHQVRQLWEDTLQKSPLVRTLQNAVELELSFKIVL